MLNGVAAATALPMKFKEDRAMKKTTMILAALLAAMAWTGCQNTLEMDDPSAREEKPVTARDSVTLTLEAGKGIDTKALALDTSGEKDQLNAFWESDEKVYVFASGSDPIGTLTATPTSDATKATLSGIINATGLAKDQTLTLLFPKSTWSYEGQNGKLTGEGSIASNYDFAKAEVTITEIDLLSENNKHITTTKSTTFENQQSIYRFRFKYGTNGGSILNTKTVQLTSSHGLLVKNVNMATRDKTNFSSTEPMLIELDQANPFVYIALLLNGDKNQDDTFSFEIYDNDGATYYGSKVIPAASLKKAFVSSQNTELAQRLELPQGETSVATAL